jgi:hypothetical protein
MLLSQRRAKAGQHDAESCAGLPKAFLDCEHTIIRDRRRVIETSPNPSRLPDEFVGLALSGGGVRSATFNLGFLQGLATHRVLRVVDYLSTVSGGGYIGSFLGRFYTRFLNRPIGAVDVIEARIRDVNSPEISWLRRSSEYVAAATVGEAPVTTAVILRAFLTVHCIVGMALVAVFDLANLFRYAAFPWFVDRINPMLAHVTRLTLPVQVVFPDPWLLLLVVVIVVGLMPLAIAYWLPSDSRPESYQPTTLTAFILSSAAGFMFALRSETWLLAASVLATTVSVFFWMESAWRHVARILPRGTTHPSGRAMVRNQLSKRLGVAVSFAAVLFSVWMLNEMVHRLYSRGIWVGYVVVFAVSFALLLLQLRWVALWLFAGASTPGVERGIHRRVITNPFLLPLAGGAPLLIGWNFVSHAMFQGGADVTGGFAWTVVTWVISAILGGRGGIRLVNESSALPLNAARGSRAYLGASNPYRHVTEMGGDVTSPQPEDDMPFERYRPDRTGGPVHIINVFANQSLDRTSGRRTRDRQGENMAIGPCGVSVGPASHAMWVRGPGTGDLSTKLRAVDQGYRPDPFVSRLDSEGENRSADLQTSDLRLSQWMALSGATLAPGTNADTRLGTSLLYGLANVRAGFWWDSGIEDGGRAGEPLPSVWQKIVRPLMPSLRAQRLLFAEFTGRFAGPCRRYWYLSDGGHADDLGVYELVRRRVPIIICADATRDADGGLAALAHAMRRVRVDFDATFEFLSASALDDLVADLAAAGRPLPQSVIDVIGTLDDVRSEPNANSRKHAALARVRYEGTSTQSVFLYVKATITGDEPVDVIEYRRQHRLFPHQSVLDQFLDEAQWESYRELGLHCASPLFSHGGAQWLADVLNAREPDPGISTPRV